MARDYFDHLTRGKIRKVTFDGGYEQRFFLSPTVEDRLRPPTRPLSLSFRRYYLHGRSFVNKIDVQLAGAYQAHVPELFPPADDDVRHGPTEETFRFVALSLLCRHNFSDTQCICQGSLVLFPLSDCDTRVCHRPSSLDSVEGQMSLRQDGEQLGSSIITRCASSVRRSRV